VCDVTNDSLFCRSGIVAPTHCSFLLLKGKFSIIESITGVPVGALAADFWIPDTIQTADYWRAY
jgi:hypothetical protein